MEALPVFGVDGSYKRGGRRLTDGRDWGGRRGRAERREVDWDIVIFVVAFDAAVCPRAAIVLSGNTDVSGLASASGLDGREMGKRVASRVCTDKDGATVSCAGGSATGNVMEIVTVRFHRNQS